MRDHELHVWWEEKKLGLRYHESKICNLYYTWLYKKSLYNGILHMVIYVFGTL